MTFCVSWVHIFQYIIRFHLWKNQVESDRKQAIKVENILSFDFEIVFLNGYPTGMNESGESWDDIRCVFVICVRIENVHMCRTIGWIS